MKHHPMVFISYPREESAWVQGFVESLHQQGVETWYDRSQLHVGDPLRESVEAGLRKSDGVVFVMTNPASQNPGLLFEIGAAMGMGKRVIPVITPEVDPATIPVDLRLRQWIVRGEPESTAAQVASALTGSKA